tara:strand:+ start:45 stop:335 length:291 start_codon:yes stop_codon:yes gene_type:complete
MNHMRKLSVGLLVLILQMGFAHAVQHELHDFNPTALTIEHDDGDCLLADTPQAKSAFPTLAPAFTISPQHDLPPTSTRHVKKTHSKASPRAPPISF